MKLSYPRAWSLLMKNNAVRISTLGISIIIIIQINYSKAKKVKGFKSAMGLMADWSNMKCVAALVEL